MLMALSTQTSILRMCSSKLGKLFQLILKTAVTDIGCGILPWRCACGHGEKTGGVYAMPSKRVMLKFAPYPRHSGLSLISSLLHNSQPCCCGHQPFSSATRREWRNIHPGGTIMATNCGIISTSGIDRSNFGLSFLVWHISLP